MPERDPFVPFSLTLDGAEEAVRDGLARAMACLAPLMLTPEEAGTVELVLAEALNNVVEHALAGSGGTTRIDIQGRHDAAGLHLLLIDRGSPMPAGKAPGGQAPEVAVETDALPEGGFGWFVIHTLARRVRYSRVGSENHLALLLDVGREGAGGIRP